MDPNNNSQDPTAPQVTPSDAPVAGDVPATDLPVGVPVSDAPPVSAPTMPEPVAEETEEQVAPGMAEPTAPEATEVPEGEESGGTPPSAPSL